MASVVLVRRSVDRGSPRVSGRYLPDDREDEFLGNPVVADFFEKMEAPMAS